MADHTTVKILLMLHAFSHLSPHFTSHFEKDTKAASRSGHILGMHSSYFTQGPGCNGN